MSHSKSLSVLLAAVGVLFLATPLSAATIEVEFSGRVLERMADLDRIEHKLEKEFRKDRTYDRSSARFTAQQDKLRYDKVAWAGELLVPDLDNFTLLNLTRAISREALNRAGLQDTPGTLRVRIHNIHVRNYSLSVFRAPHTYAKGEMEYIDASGVARSVKFTANLSRKWTLNQRFEGPDFAFSELDITRRAGPILAEFVQEGIERLFTDADVPGPIFVRYAQAGRRIIE